MLVYHERQEALLCGQHALNNLVQSSVFDVNGLSQIAHQFDEMELAYMAQNDEGGVNSKEYLKRVSEGSGNVDANGNFSLQVLRAALENMFGLTLANIREEGAMTVVKDVTDIEGFICNKQSHWFAIRKINGRFWNLNSTKSCPVQISHFSLAKEIETLQNEGYHVFFVQDPLPIPCSSFEESQGRGAPQFWWKEEDLLSGASEKSINAATNHWRSDNVGSGFRLDGKSAEENNTGSSTKIEGLTEEEMLQMALAASLENNETKSAPNEIEECELTPEPTTSDSNTVRIQFRLPDGYKVVRRFFGSDPVGMVYAFVKSRCDNRAFELRAGFPPKAMSNKLISIYDAKLDGELVQGRFI